MLEGSGSAPPPMTSLITSLVFLIVTCVPAFASSPVQQVSGELTYNLYDGRTSRIQKSEIGHFTVLRTDEKFQFRVFDPSTTPKRLWRTVLARIFHTRNRFSSFRGSECGNRRGRHTCFHKSLGFEAPARFAGPKPRLGDMAVDASPLRRAWLEVLCGQAGSSVRLTVR